MRYTTKSKTLKHILINKTYDIIIKIYFDYLSIAPNVREMGVYAYARTYVYMYAYIPVHGHPLVLALASHVFSMILHLALFTF